MINEKGIKGFLKQRAHCYHFTLQQQQPKIQPKILRLNE